MDITTRCAMLAAAAAAVGLISCQAYEEPFPDRGGLHYPIGVEMHPDGRFLYVVNSNFDLQYRGDQGGTVSVIDTRDGEFMANATPFIPSFGAEIALSEDATTAWVPSRQDNALTVLSVADQGQALFCETDEGRRADTRDCTTNRIPDSESGSRIPTDPFGVAAHRVQRVGEDDEIHSFDLVHLSHLSGEEVTSASFPDGQLAGATMRSAGLLEGGGSQLAVRPGTDQVYVAGRNASRVDGFRPFVNDRGEVETIIRDNSVWLNEQGRAADARGLAFDDDGDWMYVATRNPSALHLVAMPADGGGTPEVVTTINLEHEPSEVQFHRGADGIERVYVPSYRRGLVEVVDPGREAVVETIEVGRSPYSMAVDPSPAHCEEPGQRCQGYVTLFDAGDGRFDQCDQEGEDCGKVAVIDLDPESDDFHTVIDTIE